VRSACAYEFTVGFYLIPALKKETAMERKQNQNPGQTGNQSGTQADRNKQTPGREQQQQGSSARMGVAGQSGGQQGGNNPQRKPNQQQTGQMPGRQQQQPQKGQNPNQNRQDQGIGEEL
jgi:hypothetical protein